MAYTMAYVTSQARSTLRNGKSPAPGGTGRGVDDYRGVDMTNDIREFHIGDVYTVATGKLVAPRHIEAVYDLCGYMTGSSPMTHQLPRLSRECEPALREQFPELTDEAMPPISSREEADAWLATLYPKYGEMVAVAPLAAVDHTDIDPIAELKLMRPDLPIIAIAAEGSE
jgi:hypothetical protein